MKLITATKAKQVASVSRVTLYRWRKLGLIKEYRTPTGKIRYDESEICKMSGLMEEKIALYARVSSNGQKFDAQRQMERLKTWCNNKNAVPSYEFIEIASGLNSKRRILNKILDMINDGKITKLVVEHKDRLTRFGFEFLERYCRERGCEIVVVDKSEVREDIVKDLIDIIICFSSKLYGKRTSKNKATKIVTEDIKTYD